jgi:hypothetical protein
LEELCSLGLPAVEFDAGSLDSIFALRKLLLKTSSSLIELLEPENQPKASQKNATNYSVYWIT